MVSHKKHNHKFPKEIHFSIFTNFPLRFHSAPWSHFSLMSKMFSYFCIMKSFGCGLIMLFFGFLLLLGSLTAATISEGGISFSIILITIGGSIVAYVYFETRTNNRVNAASNAGNYIVGLPGIDNPVPNIMLKVEKPEAVFYQVQIDGWK